MVRGFPARNRVVPEAKLLQQPGRKFSTSTSGALHELPEHILPAGDLRSSPMLRLFG